MKKLLVLLVMLFWFGQAEAQVTETPNLGLNIISPNTPNWGPLVNENFNILDAKVPTLNLSCSDGQVPTWASGKFSICGSGAGHAIYDETTLRPTRPKLRFMGAGVVATDNAAEDATDVTISGTALNITGTGLIVQSSDSPQTFVARSMTTADTSNLTITNPAGIAGNPTIAIGPNVALSTRSFTATTGDWSFSSALSLAVPSAPGAAPSPGRIAYEPTLTVFRGGTSAGAKTFAFTDQIQPVDPGLTQIAELTAVQNSYLLYRGGTWIAPVRPSCSGAGQATNFDTATGTEGCVTIGAGGITGLTPDRVPMALTSSTLTDSPISVLAGTTTVNGPLVVGTGPFYLIPNASALTADREWIIQNVGGTILPAAAAGTFTNDHVLKAVVAGGIVTIADGGTAGIGDQTASSVASYTNKTINPEATGNQITQVSVTEFKFASCSDGSTASLQWEADSTGLAQPTAACTSGGTVQRPGAKFSGTATNAMTMTFRLPKGLTGNIDYKQHYMSTTASPTGNIRWCIETQSRAVGQTVGGGTFNTPQCVTDAVSATQNALNEWSQTALDLTGAAAEENFTIRVSRLGGDALDTNGNADDGWALSGFVTLRWIQQSQ